MSQENRDKNKTKFIFIFIFLAILLIGWNQAKKNNVKPRVEVKPYVNTSQFDKCLDNIESKCESACSIDALDTYCGVIYLDKVVGSGCVSEMRKLPFKERVEKCKKEACRKMVVDAFDACR